MPKFVPTPTPPTGWVAIAKPAAAPPVPRVNVDDVALVSPVDENVKVCVVGEITPVSVAAENVATPEEVVAEVVPPIVPGDAVTDTLVGGCDESALPPASTTVTAGFPSIAPPDVPPDDG